jgi:hypothetical protein
MAESSTYLLRTTNEGKTYYLSNVSPNGCNVEFDMRIDHGWRFTAEGRADLTKRHSHIRGRWVRLDREERRRAAAPIQPTREE